MASSTAVTLASTRFVSAALTPAEADVFDKLCESSGRSPNEVGALLIAFVCRSISGLREIRNGDIDAMLAEEFGDIRNLIARLSDLNARIETTAAATRALGSMITPAIAGGSLDEGANK